MKYVIIDSNAIIHRAFHALPPFTAPDGSPTGAVYGFSSILIKIIKDLRPDFIMAAFDTKAPTFRHIAFEKYKAQREKAPDELYSQFPKVKEVLSAFKIPIIEKDGFEADDIIGTLAKQITNKEKKAEVVIVTGDLDTLQLVDKNVSVFTMRKGVSDTILYDENAVKERFGFGPKTMVDYKALRGDPSDNIPGVKGIGEKTATELLKKYGTLEKIYELSDKNELKESPSLLEKLKNSKNEAFLSKELATIKRDVDIGVPDKELSPATVSLTGDIKKVFEGLGFKSLLSRFEGADPAETAPKKETADKKNSGKQGFLFHEEAGTSKKTGKVDTFDDAKAPLSINPEYSRRIDNSASLIALFQNGPVAFFYDEEKNSILTCSKGKISNTKTELFKKLNDSEIAIINSCEKIIFDAKPLIKKLAASGVNITGNFFDLKIAGVLLSIINNDSSPQKLVSAYLKKETGTNPEEWLSCYFEIKESFKTKLKEEEIWFVFSEIEIPLIPVLAEMEITGIKINKNHLIKMSGFLKREIGRITRKIFDFTEEEFNINSPQQLAEIIFIKMGIGKNTHKFKKTPGGKVSTNEEQLQDLKNSHPIIPLILEYRELMKLKSTYTDALPKLIQNDHRIHTTYDQTGTVTGRLSSKEPNVQHIPVGMKLGKEIRKAFIAEQGFILASFDYSQLELRIAADISGDPKMIESFSRDEDIHKITASEINNVPLDKVTPEMRREAKTLNFGILYGMSARSFAKGSGMSEADAKKFYDKYFENFTGIKNYIAETINFAKINGYVKTHFGRRRYIPEILGSGFRAEKEAERMAINFPIQGTATGDIIKLAMVAVSILIKNKYNEKDVKLLLQIHDELLFEIKDEKEVINTAVRDIKAAMEKVWTGKVKLIVDAKTGKNWAEMG